MVTNLPAEARAKWLKVMDAKTPEEKLAALQEFLSAVPKHKGTENLVQWARRRMAALREEIEERRRRRGGGYSFFVEKEGAAQIVVIGPPNTGKSSVVAQLTNAKPLIAPYPYSTTRPQPGMLTYEDIQIQLVDTPPLTSEKGGWNSRVMGLARNADGLIIVLSLEDDPLRQLRLVLRRLEEANIVVRKPRGRVVIERVRGARDIKVIAAGRMKGYTADDVKNLLRSYRIYGALVKIYGETTLDDVEKAIFENTTYKPAIILANKADLPGSAPRFKRLSSAIPPDIPLQPVSALRGRGFEDIGRMLFSMLGLIRIYTKQPNGDIAEKPLVLRRGATVLDVARSIHSRLVKNFRYAKIWGPSAKYPGERVGLDHEVMDGDIVEIHARG